MAAKRTSLHGEWSSRWAFILAATGSAVGLGNIWRFPFIAGENGGGAFVLLYLLCVLVVGVPILMAEILLGRRGRRSPLNAMRALAADGGHARAWQAVGWMGMVAGFVILSYYSVIAGWTLAYGLRAACGVFEGVQSQDTARIFADFTSDPEKLLAWHTIFMAMNIVVVSRGVRSGLERAVRYLMPALFLLLILLAGYAMSTEKFDEGIAYLFVPHMDRFTGDFGSVFLNALGQAFFSLSLGMGAMMVYGSYLPERASIPACALSVAFADTLVAVLAGIAIFPVIFSYGMQPSGGAGLIFISLPIAFGQMPGGEVLGTLFFLLLMFAAWTSSISLLEPAVSWLVENVGMSRIRAAASAGAAAWLLGLLTVMSFSHWAFSFRFAGVQKNRGFFDLFDVVAANFLLPAGGVLIALFAAWLMPARITREELNLDRVGYAMWRIATRYLAPIGVLVIMLHGTGLI